MRHLIGSAARFCMSPAIVVAVLLLAHAGCADRPYLPTPYAAEKAAEVAMQTYDGNGDGKLDAAELEKCLSLKDALARVDADGDGAVTGAEIAQRIKAYEAQSDLVATMIHVASAGRPVAGASVTLAPEPFMGEDFQSYVGTSDEQGNVQVEGEKAKAPGLPLGFYQVHISQPSGGAVVTRGCEIADDVPEVNRLGFSL